MIELLKNYFKQRGQVSLLFALLMPIFLLLLGVVLDLGWYYLNVSRLQNAADAAAVAGAQALVEKESFSEYKSISLVGRYPGRISDEYRPADNSVQESIEDVNTVAEKYVSKNLEGKNSNGSKIDYWTKTSYESEQGLYEKDNNLYYVVKLQEEIRHFFLPGWFNDMNAPVTSIALLSKQVSEKEPVVVEPPQPEVINPEDEKPIRSSGTGAEIQLPEGTNILIEMYKLEDVSAIRNWEWQNWYKNSSVTYSQTVPVEYLRGTMVEPTKAYKELTGKDIYGGKWNEYQDKTKDTTRNDYTQKVVHFNNGDLYRTETVSVYAGSSDETKADTGSSRYSEGELDSINLDFHPDINSNALKNHQFTEDWDIGYPTPEGKTLEAMQNKSRSSTDGHKFRIHSTFNFTTPYKVRASNKYDVKKNPEDVLYVRIESEPIIALPFVKNQATEHTVYSTVRQIILNINQSNYNTESQKYRPLMFFYDGPEKIDEDSHVRDSQPVILNLYADARVILFAPNSPVVINGNGHQMHGFVIAKEFRYLTTEADYMKVGDKYYDPLENTTEGSKEYFKITNSNGAGGTCDMFINEIGNVQTKTYDLNSSVTRNPIYDNDLEKPLDTSVIEYRSYEKVFKMNKAFNLDTGDDKRGTTYYDAFRVSSLKRRIYTYLDNYEDKDKPNAVDMFFTTLRSTWVN